MEFNN